VNVNDGPDHTSVSWNGKLRIVDENDHYTNIDALYTSIYYVKKKTKFILLFL
jgi:hypothetical protein